MLSDVGFGGRGAGGGSRSIDGPLETLGYVIQ